MKISSLVLSSILAIALTTPTVGQEISTAELSSPLIELMPAFKKVRTELKLNEKQSEKVDAWLAEAPKKKAQLKHDALKARAELREALISRDSRVKRDQLKTNLETANRRIIEMESLCARMLSTTLNKQQYAKVVAQYRTTVKS